MKQRIKQLKADFSISLFMRFGMFLCLFTMLSAFSISAQTKEIRGVVVDEFGEPFIGVTVAVEGTTNGTITDFNGAFSIKAEVGSTLVFSFIGAKAQNVKVTSGTSVLNIKMEEDSQLLEETVVIGYGTAKAKDLTSPITVIDGAELTKNLTSSPMSGLQGRVAGVQITPSGQPGSSPKVRIRGVGNMDEDKQGPLYVVDGMFFDNIDFLSNSDIDNMSILKDASSAAIYGVRAANGVVIVTTKKGVPNRAPQITYDGHVGFQKATNVLKMANSRQYSTIMREGDSNPTDPNSISSQIDKSIALWGGENGIPSTNTDWYDQLLKTAFYQNHSLSATGGGEGISYALGVNYLNQEGILDVKNGYERVNTHARLDANLTSWLKAGVNVIITNDKRQENSGNTWLQAYANPSIYPATDASFVNDRTNPKGFVSPGSTMDYTNFFWNPVAIADYGQNKFFRTTQILPSYYLQGTFLDNKLTVKSAFSQELKFLRYTEVVPKFTIGGAQIEPDSYIQKRTEFNNNWILDNTATYSDIVGKHAFSGMLGNSVRNERWELLRVEGKGIDPSETEYWYVKAGTQTIRDPNDADDGSEIHGLSFFGRVTYDYDGKYLLSATMRADGSSKYQEKWGYFPSVGLGWVATQENFMKDAAPAINFLKLRANWGRLGNDRIPTSTGFSSKDPSNGVWDGQTVPGYTALSFFSYLKWEVVEEFDLGFDFVTLNNRLSVNFDYFDRTTHDAVFNKPIPNIPKTILNNNGKINNRGVELSLGWNDKVGKDFNYFVNVNATYVKNKVTSLDGLSRILDADEIRINMVGQPYNAFYGYKVLGVYQTQDEIDNDPFAVANSLEVGDFKYKHAEGSTELLPEDREILGSHIPKWRLGGTLGGNYKNWDFSLSFSAIFNVQIFNYNRALRNKNRTINFDENWAKNIWTESNHTNEYPSAKGSVKDWNVAKMNSFYVENGDAFSIQNINLGYTFDNVFKGGSKKSALRLSLTAERPFNFFSYNGFSTDVATGIDTNTYPLASTFSFGVRLTY